MGMDAALHTKLVPASHGGWQTVSFSDDQQTAQSTCGKLGI